MTCENFQDLEAGLGAANQLIITPTFPFDDDDDLRLDIYNYDSLRWANIPRATGRTVDLGAPTSGANDFYSWEVFLDGTTKKIRTVLATSSTTPALPGGGVAKHPPVPNTGTTFPIEDGSLVNVRLYRKTSIARGELPAIFYPGAAVKAEDLNNNFEALRRVVEEGACFDDAAFEARYWNQIDIDNNGETWFSDSTTAWPGNDTTVTSTGGGDVQWSTLVQEPRPNTNVIGKTWFRDSDDILHIWNGTDWVPVKGSTADDTAYTDVFFVSAENGSDSNDGHSVTQAMRTIRHAVNAANGDITDTIEQFSITTNASTSGLTNGTFFVPQSATTGSGTGAILKVVVTGTDTATVSLDNGGSGHAATDVITFDRTGTYGGAADIKITVSTVSSQAQVNNGLVFVFPGTYAELVPIRMKADNLSVVGQAMRSCFVHPNVEGVPNYATTTPSDPELSTMFEMGDASYITGFTFAGMKAGGNTEQAPTQTAGKRRWNQVTRLDNGKIDAVGDRSAALDPGVDGFRGLPNQQGWIAAFWNTDYRKSPYIQNCTVFSDSEIDNRIANFDPNNLQGGEARDQDSSCTGGGILCDGNVPKSTSPLRSFVVDSFTQINLDGPGILCTNNGYAQLVSFFGTFCHYHAKARNGGQLNLSNCTTDFGRFGLLAEGRSTDALITGKINGTGLTGYTFAVGPPQAWTAGSTAIPVKELNSQAGWTTNIPGSTYVMEVENGATDDVYLIGTVASITNKNVANGTCTVNILSPSPGDASTNLGLYRNTNNDTVVRFFRQSYISTGGHTMEFVGAGCDYRAIPELGGQAVQTNQIVEEGGFTPAATAGPASDLTHFANKNGGRVYYSGTDENGRFQVGGNTDNIVFTANQKTGELTVNADAINPQVDLQAACDAGNFTTTDINVGNTSASPRITLDNSGTANFRHDDNTVYNPSNFGDTTIRLANFDTTNNSFAGFRWILGSSNTGVAGLNAIRTGGQQSALGFVTSRATDRTNGLEAMRIDHNGDVLIGGTLPGSPNITFHGNDGRAEFAGRLDSGVNGVPSSKGRLQTFLGGQETDPTLWQAFVGFYDSAPRSIIQADGSLFLSGTNAADQPTFSFEATEATLNIGAESRTSEAIAHFHGDPDDFQSVPTVVCEAEITWNDGDQCRFKTVAASREGTIGVANVSGSTAGFVNLSRRGAQNGLIWVDTNGDVRTSAGNPIEDVGGTSGTVVGDQTSDRRMKKDISNYTEGLSVVEKLQPVNYTYKGQERVHAGFIAQDVQSIVPEAVYDTKNPVVDMDDNGVTTMDSDNKPLFLEGEDTQLAMSYVELIPALVNAVKELSAKVQQLESQ